jgi:hypothetical protein
MFKGTVPVRLRVLMEAEALESAEEITVDNTVNVVLKHVNQIDSVFVFIMSILVVSSDSR